MCCSSLSSEPVLCGGADADAAGEYFDYSIDELGLQDIKAADVLIEKIVSKELATK